MADGTAIGERKDILCENIHSLFTTQRHSDFSIHCGARSWKVHKSVICTRSTYFEKACTGDFKESSQGFITFQDDDPSTINAVLKFLYSAEYDDEGNKDEQGEELHPLSFNVLVYAAADKYDLEDLGKLALAKFTGRTGGEWGTEGFADAVGLIYTGAQSGKSAMRMSAVEVIRENAQALLIGETGAKLREVIGSTPELGLEALVALAMEKPEPVPQPAAKRYRCRRRVHCGAILEITALNDEASYNCPKCGTTNDGSYLRLRPA